MSCLELSAVREIPTLDAPDPDMTSVEPGREGVNGEVLARIKCRGQNVI